MKPEKRSLFASHPLAIALTVAVILFLVGGVIVLRRSGRAPNPETTSWGVSGAALPTQDTGLSSFTDASASDFTNTPTDILRFTVPSNTIGSAQPTTQEQTFESYLSGLFGNTAYTSEGRSGVPAGVLEAYFYLPQGSTGVAVKADTPAQTALRAYGNAAGSIILGFESSHPGMIDVLTAQSRDRQDAKNAAALKELAADLADIGTTLEKIEGVPVEAQEAHRALAAGYKEIGAKLALVADIQPDKDYIASINAYNTAADAFMRRFLDVATLFSLSGVKFSAGEGGSAFSFPGGGGL